MLEKLKHAIETDIEETKKYSQFMKDQIMPMLTTVGRSHMEHMHFFNLGYQFALEKLLSVLEDNDAL